MKLLVAGSRSIDGEGDYEWLKEMLDSIPELTEIVSGKARGVDSLGERYAAERGIPVKEFPPNFQRYHKLQAPLERNKEMAAYCDAALIMWDGYSTGSQHMMEQMRKVDKLCQVYRKLVIYEQIRSPV